MMTISKANQCLGYRAADRLSSCKLCSTTKPHYTEYLEGFLVHISPLSGKS